MSLLLWIVHDRNANGYQTCIDTFAEHMRALDERFKEFKLTAQAFSAARKKLPFEILENLCQQTSQWKDAGGFKGFEVYAIDGTGFGVPDTAQLNEHFNKHHAYGTQAYLPQGNLVAAVNVQSKTICHAMVDCLHSSEKQLAECLIGNFTKPSVFVLDRGLATQNIFKKVFIDGHQAVARLRTDKAGLKCFQNFAQSLKTQDYVQLPNGVPLRLVKVKLQNYKKPIIIGTTLPESLASKKDLRDIYDSPS